VVPNIHTDIESLPSSITILDNVPLLRNPEYYEDAAEAYGLPNAKFSNSNEDRKAVLDYFKYGMTTTTTRKEETVSNKKIASPERKLGNDAVPSKNNKEKKVVKSQSVAKQKSNSAPLAAIKAGEKNERASKSNKNLDLPSSRSSSSPTNEYVVLLTCSDGFYDMWLNWLIFFEKLAIPNLPVHLFAEDEATYVKCQQLADEIIATADNNSSSSRYRADLTCLPWNFAFSQDTLSSSIGATTYGSRGYKTMMSHRPAIIKRELELGKSVIFSDVDVVWKKDPLPYLGAELKTTATAKAETEEVHVLAQDDENGGLCPGFMIYISCPPTISFVEQWRAELDGKNSRNQVVFNKLLERNPNFVAKALPLKLFVNGGLYSKEHKMTQEERELAVVVHNNYIAGYDEKLDRFKMDKKHKRLK